MSFPESDSVRAQIEIKKALRRNNDQKPPTPDFLHPGELSMRTNVLHHPLYRTGVQELLETDISTWEQQAVMLMLFAQHAGDTETAVELYEKMAGQHYVRPSTPGFTPLRDWSAMLQGRPPDVAIQSSIKAAMVPGMQREFREFFAEGMMTPNEALDLLYGRTETTIESSGKNRELAMHALKLTGVALLGIASWNAQHVEALSTVTQNNIDLYGIIASGMMGLKTLWSNGLLAGKETRRRMGMYDAIQKHSDVVRNMIPGFFAAADLEKLRPKGQNEAKAANILTSHFLNHHPYPTADGRVKSMKDAIRDTRFSDQPGNPYGAGYDTKYFFGPEDAPFPPSLVLLRAAIADRVRMGASNTVDPLSSNWDGNEGVLETIGKERKIGAKAALDSKDLWNAFLITSPALTHFLNIDQAIITPSTPDRHKTGHDNILFSSAGENPGSSGAVARVVDTDLWETINARNSSSYIQKMMESLAYCLDNDEVIPRNFSGNIIGLPAHSEALITILAANFHDETDPQTKKGFLKDMQSAADQIMKGAHQEDYLFMSAFLSSLTFSLRYGQEFLTSLREANDTNGSFDRNLHRRLSPSRMSEIEAAMQRGMKNIRTLQAGIVRTIVSTILQNDRQDLMVEKPHANRMVLPRFSFLMNWIVDDAPAARKALAQTLTNFHGTTGQFGGVDYNTDYFDVLNGVKNHAHTVHHHDKDPDLLDVTHSVNQAFTSIIGDITVFNLSILGAQTLAQVKSDAYKAQYALDYMDTHEIYLLADPLVKALESIASDASILADPSVGEVTGKVQSTAARATMSFTIKVIQMLNKNQTDKNKKAAKRIYESLENAQHKVNIARKKSQATEAKIQVTVRKNGDH